ncbi:cell adhesion molecule Dscam1 isoform X1 [Neodiprion pinetum]|uniref:cell adhesion molecule Dscam1 isoform X1 n=2 Tax=Neodiprion pinetum TaxID=441929 RepID=UPI001EDE46A9|nr:Down syndrome cell adhesion molecule-like protein Dscam2 isoform X1 [Neodiprion pinetum]XP_046477032.1 Down syndrome cell adhesion molecule-like protein Dscam2 isoform X1 [Neodiprion pinetum]
MEFDLLPFLLLLSACSFELAVGQQGPFFIQEPPSTLVFSNTTGSQLSCSAHGSPTPHVTWTTSPDQRPVTAVPGLRQLLGNGTLYFPPFLAQDFRAEVHSARYRCRASNSIGTVLSREVTLRAVLTVSGYDVRVNRAPVVTGCNAVLSCTTREDVKEHLTVTSWFRDDAILLPGSTDTGGRFVVTSQGELHIRAARAEDGRATYSCLTLHSLTGERRRSDPATLTVTEQSGSMRPTLTQRSQMVISAEKGSNTHITCSAQGSPPPVFTWYKDVDGHLIPVESSSRIQLWGDLMQIRRVDAQDAGRYVCRASNQFGEQRAETHLAVTSKLNARIHPQIQTVHSGAIATMNCTVEGYPVESVEWLHDGVAVLTGQDSRINLQTPLVLVVSFVGRRDRGMYQCLVRSDKENAQATAEVQLGDTVPELQYTFIEQALTAGRPVSLRCSATGSPPPSFTWLLDGQPLGDIVAGHRYAIGQYVDQSGDVISHLNISSAGSEDGGLYTCVAANALASVEHKARLNIYGSPYIRSIAPVRAIAGKDITIACPYSGYPITSVEWSKGGVQLPLDIRQKLNEGLLTITSVDTNDNGTYTCTVRRSGETASRDIVLTVSSPPVMTPFSFDQNLQEGKWAQATCSVTSGDLPIYFTWLKDGEQIPPSLRIEEQVQTFYSLLLFHEVSSRHSGKYTCIATNHAAKVNHTAELLVKVPPQWTFEPQDVSTLLGNPLNIHCEAKGFPPPQITWLRGQGRSSNDFQPLIVLDGRITIQPNGSLWTASAGPQDEGHYLCRANNGIGLGLNKLIYVSVNEPARFEIQSKNVTIRRGEPVSLDCSVIGDNPIEVQWTHNNNRLDLNNYRLSISQVKSEEGLKSQLSIGRSDRQDSGVYRCVASNVFGISEHLIYLAIQERPDPPMALEVIEIGSRSIRLSWKQSFDGNSPIINYAIQYRPLGLGVTEEWDSPQTHNITINAKTTSIGGATNPTLNGLTHYDTMSAEQEMALVGGLHPAVTYTFRMFAVNAIEASAPTDPVVAKTQEEAPMDSPQSVSVQSAGPGELIVSWQTPSRDMWNGELLGYIVTWSEHSTSTSGVNQSKSLTVNGWATTKIQLTGLRKFTKYDVTVRAFNSIASGPASNPVVGTTQEGVPEAPPAQVMCTPLSSQSVKVSWAAPPAHQHGGIIQGYKVYYRPVPTDNMEISTVGEVKRTSSEETYLHTLYKYTNYSIRVLAYTGAGDGELSLPTYCSTEEDVPGPPAGIKALALTADSILVSWLPPLQPNGHVSLYTVYSREAGATRNNTHTMHDPPSSASDTLTMELRGLTVRQLYEFWVTATTGLGEGERTTIVTQTTDTRIPARVASFSQIMRKAVKSSVTLPCLVVGNPTPRPKWTYKNSEISTGRHYELTSEGHLNIHSLEQSVAGNYTCSANNLFGDDSVTYTVIVVMPPRAPKLELQYTTPHSIRLRWNHPDNGGATIQGYVLSYKRDRDGWEEIAVSPEQTAYTLSDLKCGSSYLAHLTAHNRVGTGEPSGLISATTKGSAPLLPKERDIISANSTTLRLNLLSWPTGGCPILYYTVEYKKRSGSESWIMVANRATENLVIRDLKPASWYNVRLTAHNDAGAKETQMEFATTTITGVSIGPPNDLIMDNDAPKGAPTHRILYIVIPVVCALVLVLCTILLGYVVLKRGSYFLNTSHTICQHSSAGNFLSSRESGGYLGEMLAGQQQQQLQQPVGMGLAQQMQPGMQQLGHQPHHLSSCMSTVQLKSTAERDNRRNHQVYTSSPVKQENLKPNDHGSEMYEISPYATFSVPGRENRSVTTATLDYTMQFKTFGHLENEDINIIDYERSSIDYERSKTPRWHKQRYFPSIAEAESKLRSNRQGSGSDTSGSPCGECAGPSYRVPVKPCRDIFSRGVESSTESNNEGSPLARRRSRQPSRSTRSSVDDMTLLPPTGFSDSRELSEAECDRDCHALSIATTRHGGSLGRLPIEAIETMLARYQQRKEQERQEFTIHV